MKTILEYINDNDEIIKMIYNILDNSLISESQIEESFLFESKLNFNPKDEQELSNLLEIRKNDYNKIDEINDEYSKYLKENKFNTDKYFHWKLLNDDWTDLSNTLKIGNVGICIRSNNFLLCTFNWENNTREDVLSKINYDFSKSFFDNLFNLFYENKVIWYQFIKKDSYLSDVKFITDKSKVNEYKLIKLEDTKNQENSSDNESSTQENVKNTVTDSIKDNKDLLTPLAKAANITGEKLRDIITKVCLDKNGKARKLDDSVIIGLSVMLCGVILTIKKSGKSDNAAILAVTDRIAKIVKSKKSIKNNI